MWECPKCRRTFKKLNQAHYCGEKPTTIDDYIAEYSDEIQTYMTEVRTIIKEAIPTTKEKIAWGMPTFWQQRNIIHFAANQAHLGLYSGPKAVNAFSKELDKLNIQYSKGAIQLPYDQPIPAQLIANIARWCFDYEMTKLLPPHTETQGDTSTMIEFKAEIEPVPDKGGAYVRVPINIKEVFGKGRLKVQAHFDDVVYEGSVVNMGVKHDDGTICYIIGIRKDIQKQLNKTIGETVSVRLLPLL